MTQSFFRPEVLRAKGTSWLGGISLAQPIRLWVLTAFAAFVALLVILFLVVGTYTRRSRVAGQLVPVQGMATVLAPATGVVTRVIISEGERVEAGQTIAIVTMPRATVTGGDAIAALQQRLARRTEGLESSQSAQQQVLDAQASGLANQVATARRELAQIEAEVATRREQVRLANETLGRLRPLRDEQYVSELQVKQQEAEALTQVSELQALQRQAIVTRRLIAQLRQAKQELPGRRQANQAGFQRDLALLEQEQVELRASGELAIIAPVSGVVATQLFKSGQAVHAGQSLMSILPGDGLLEAELLVPSRAIGFIDPGDQVLLRYHAYPYQKFGRYQGRVARVSRSTLGATPQSAVSGASARAPFYRVSVTLDRQMVTAYGRLVTLKPGMALDADVLGERRTLIEWILEPLFSLKGRVVND